MHKVHRILLAVFASAACSAASAQLAVVAGAKSPLAQLNAEQVSGLFLGRTEKLPDGSTPTLLDQDESASVRDGFYTKVTGKSAAQVKAAWSRLVFSGKGQPPKVVHGSDEVKKQVNANPAAIGYVERGAVDGSVKVLLSVD